MDQLSGAISEAAVADDGRGLPAQSRGTAGAEDGAQAVPVEMPGGAPGR
jgi:hypothetical protein